MLMDFQKKRAVIWHLQTCVVTFYPVNENDKRQDRKQPIATESLLPDNSLAYRQIQELNISKPSLPHLKHLTRLIINGNYLSNLPSELWRLPNLRELNVARNRIKRLPPDIARLEHLEEFYIHDNTLEEIPVQVGRLSRLRVLDATGNNLRCLPAQILNLRLTNLWVERNCFYTSSAPEEKIVSNAEENQDCVILPLRSVCLQAVGSAILSHPLLEDSLKNSVLAESVVDQLLSIKDDPVIAPLCFQCSAIMFHNGLSIVRYVDGIGMGRVPFLYKVCSQSCLNNLVKSDTAF